MKQHLYPGDRLVITATPNQEKGTFVIHDDLSGDDVVIHSPVPVRITLTVPGLSQGFIRRWLHLAR